MYLSHRVRTKNSMEDWFRVHSYRRHEQQRLRKGERAGVGEEEAQISLRHCERVPWGKDRDLDWEGDRGWRLGVGLVERIEKLEITLCIDKKTVFFNSYFVVRNSLQNVGSFN